MSLRWWFLGGIAAFLGIFSAGGQVDPNLRVTIRRTNQNVVLRWFASNGVPYQVESSTTLTTWGDSSLVITGSGTFFSLTNAMGRLDRNFFRVERLLPPQTVSASFNAGTGVLTIIGDAADNVITVSRNAAGTLLVNNGGVPVSGGVPTVANTTLIEMFGRAGHDQLTLNETSGALPRANMFGEAGNDTLTGGSGADSLNGGIGNDTLLGRGGADTLLGGDDSDTLTGGDADDQVFGELGNDRFIWNPGDDTDLNEGGGDIDTVEVNGGGGDEQFTTTANGLRVRFDRLNPAPFSLDIGTCENLVLNANSGNDSFSATGNLAALIQITVDGGPGDDTLLGSNGIDLLLGGDNNDFIDGQQGNDLVLMGAGNDTFQWDPGDGSDTLEGQAGTDTLRFNGSNANEIFDVSANGARVLFTRNIAAIVMDLDDVETIELNALGGTDSVNINSLGGTDLTGVTIDLATFGGGGDALADVVIVNGTSGEDVITATLPGGRLVVSGLAAAVTVENYETGFDVVRIQALEGNDVIDASAVPMGGVPLALDGGVGDDILIGGAGADSLLGGDHDDVLLGGAGADVLDGGLGENTLLQDVGSSVTNGIVTVFGNAVGNAITIRRDAAGNILSNNVLVAGATVANTALIRVFGLGGNDTLAVDESLGALPAVMLFGGSGLDTITGGSGGDLVFGGSDNDTLLGRGGFDFLFGGGGQDTLTGGDADDQVFGESGGDRFVWNPGDDTDLNEGGSGTDTVEVNGGGGDEQFTTTANGTRVRFDRLNPAPFSLDMGTCENLVLNANGGADSFSATGNLAALIQITVDGGAGNDTLLGSNGADLLIGGDNDDFIDGQQGNDVVFLGNHNDTFQWDPGDGSDILEGQAGVDKLFFNGSNANEIFTVAANGGRVMFLRDIAAILMDLDDVETIELNTLGGTDRVTVNDLAGTDLADVLVDLAAVGGGGDALNDVVSVNGTSGDDVITATLPGGRLAVSGLAPMVTVENYEPTLDTVAIQGLDGNDVIDASAVAASGIPLILDGGSGDDVLLGGAGGDRLFGGDNDDVLLGGAGVDTLDGGLGENVVFQDAGSTVTNGIVSLFGNGAANSITISRDAGGNILSNGVVIAGAAVANTALIRVFGMGSNDVITLNEASGALPPAMLFGGGGIDTITGGSGSDLIFGGIDNDTLLGRGGFDFLFGGGGQDTLTGGDADDQVFGEVGNDRFVWNPGDDTDLNEGGSGTDTVEVNGGGGDEQFTTTANGARVRFDRLNPAPFALDVGTCENLVLNANGGADSFSATGNLAALIQITVDGGAGNDTLLGSNGADLLIGGDNDDFIDGQQGNDVVFLGGHNDTFQWDPGDGSDVIEGQAGLDRLIFNGSAANEIFDLSANGARVRFTRNIATIVMDIDDVESIELQALGGTDALTVNNVAGTDLTSITANLASTLGGSAGDALVDTVTVNGTAAGDVINITANAGVVEVSGLATLVRIANPEVANDDLIVNGLTGVDIFNVGPGVTSLIGVTTNQ